MTYQDILEVVGESATTTKIGTSRIGVLATRTSNENPDHHLWNNRGTWWCHFTLHRDDYTSERVRASLKTQDVTVARERRDQLLASVGGGQR